MQYFAFSFSVYIKGIKKYLVIIICQDLDMWRVDVVEYANFILPLDAFCIYMYL